MLSATYSQMVLKTNNTYTHEHRGSNEGRSRTRAGWGWGGSSGRALPTAGRAARGAHAGKAKREHLLCQQTHGPHWRPEAGDRRPKVRARGRNPTPAFLTLHHGQGGKIGEGPREQTEKSGRVHQERPSLVWHGLGPARESTTTPHRSVEPRWSRGEVPRGQSPEGPALSPTGNLRPPTSPQARAAHDPRRRTPDTWHGAHRAGVASQPSPGARSGERTG